MRYNPNIHHRKSIRLKGYDYSQCGAYFITICTQNRENYLGRILNGQIELNDIGQIVEQCWLETQKRFENIFIDQFIIMPNHFHGIVIIKNNPINHRRGLINQTPTTHQTPTTQQIPTTEKWILQKNPKLVLGKIIRSYKASASRLIHLNGFHHFRWQQNYYEHIIRNKYELNRIREYIINNPIQWELDRNNARNIFK